MDEVISISTYGVYIHVPFCSKRCPYCAFVLIESDGSLHERFVEAAEREIERSGTARAPAATVYFGGGTPSMLEPAHIARLMAAVRRRFDLREDAEATLEANPEGIALERLRDFRAAGVNRLSLGLQSFDDAELRFLGREHDGAGAVRAFELARAAGFANVSVDLIFGVPGADVASWRRTLDRAMALRPEHISLYGLTVEPGTALARQVHGGFAVPDDDAQAPLYELAMDLLPAGGWVQYEISNFARPGFESRHNLGYWDGRPYAGIGPGAHSYEAPRRWANVSNVRAYIDRASRGEDVVATREELTPAQRMLERAFLGLRRASGIDTVAWEREFGEPIEGRFGGAVAESVAGGFLERRGPFLALTRAGRLVADAVTAKFA